jgi:hypothetical protein
MVWLTKLVPHFLKNKLVKSGAHFSEVADSTSCKECDGISKEIY